MRRPRTIPGPSRLSGILAHLTKEPRLVLKRGLTKLTVSYKMKNGDFGARHFVKEELPRIRYANPTLHITVDKLHPSNPSYKANGPSVLLEFANAPSKRLPLARQWSTKIVTDLMSLAGSPSIWPQWVEERKSKGECVYVDMYGNGSGKEGYVKKKTVQRISTKPKGGHRPKGKAAEDGKAKPVMMVEERDELKDLLGLDLTPAETGPPKTGIASALP